MMKRTLIRTVVALSLLLTSAALAQTPGVADPTTTAPVELTPLESSVDTAIQTSTGGNLFVMHQQDAIVADTARIEAPVTSMLRTQGVEMALSLPAGADLFRVKPRDAARIYYCSPRVMTHPELGPTSNRGRVCLGDEDGDRAFERIGYMLIPTQYGPTGLSFPPRIVGGVIVWAANAIAPVEYATPGKELAPVSLEIVGEFTQTGIYVTVRTTTNGKHADLGGSMDVRSRPQELPKTYDVRGAKLELLSLKDGVLSYRMLQGFPPDGPISFLSMLPPSVPRPSPPPRQSQ